MTDHTTAPNTIPAWLDGRADDLDAGQVAAVIEHRAWLTKHGITGEQLDDLTEGELAEVREHARVQQSYAHIPEPWWAAGARTDGWMGLAGGGDERTWPLWQRSIDTDTETDGGRGQVHVDVIGEQRDDGSTRLQLQVHVDLSVGSDLGVLTPDTARALAAELVQAAEHAETLARQGADGTGALTAP